MEEHAHADLSRFRALIEHATDLVGIADAAGILLYTSPSVERIMGYAPETVQGTSMFGYVHPDDVETLRAVVAQSAANGAPVGPALVRVRHARGDWRTLELIIQARFADEAIRGVIINGRDLTDHLRAEAALRESEVYFRTLIEAAPVGACITDEHCRFVSMNAAFAALFGYTPDDLIGMPVQMVIPPDAVDEALGILEARRLANQTDQIELETIAKDGSGRIVLGTGVTIKTHDGRTLRASFLSDITARVEAEQAVAEARRLAEALDRVSLALSGTLEPESLYQTILEQAARILPSDHASIILHQDGWAVCAASQGVPAIEPGTPLIDLSTQAESVRALRAGQVVYLADIAAMEGWPDAPPGVGPWIIRSTIRVPLLVEGELLGTFGVGSLAPRFYNERHLAVAVAFGERAAQALRNTRLYEEEQRRANRLAALQRVTAAMSAVRLPSEIADVVAIQGAAAIGAVACAIRLLTPDGTTLARLAIAGHPLTAAIPVGDVRVDEEYAVSTVARSGRSLWLEDPEQWRVLYPETAPLYLAADRCAAAILPLVVGERVVGTLAVSFDTPRRFTEDDRTFLASLAELTAQSLERARLYAAERERARAAEDLARLRNDFVTSVSHELRTPLTAIVGFAELLEGHWEQMPEAQRRAQVSRIARAANRQRRLVEDLLLISQLGDGNLPMRAEPTAIGSLVEEAVRELAGSYVGQRIDLAGPTALAALADPERVQQVIINLLDNAAKYSPDGAAIAVSWRQEGSEAVIRIRDHGPGVAANGRERLFTRFGRAPGSPIRAGRVGTGLGLYLSRAIARAMDGDVDLETSDQDGSTFRLRLPAAGQPRA